MIIPLPVRSASAGLVSTTVGDHVGILGSLLFFASALMLATTFFFGIGVEKPGLGPPWKYILVGIIKSLIENRRNISFQTFALVTLTRST